MNAPTPSLSPAQVAQRRRGRLVLLSIFGLFFGTMALAGLLRFSNIQPAAAKQKGELLAPAIDARAAAPTLADGTPYPWATREGIWRIVVVAPEDCGTRCVTLAADLAKTWELFGHNADHVQVLWLGEFPAAATRFPALRVARAEPALVDLLPRHDATAAGLPAYIIDRNGFIAFRYAPGFNPLDLRADLAKLLNLV